MTHHAGILERRDADGRARFRVRVSRQGKTFSATLPTLEAAFAWRAQALASIESDVEPPTRPAAKRPAPEPPGRAVTIEDAARRLVRGMRDGSVRTNKGQPYKPSVVRKYEEQLRCLVLPRMGAVPTTTLTGGDVQRLVDALAAERTPEHARKALTALRVALRLAQRYGELDANQCAGVTVPVASEGEKPRRILTPEEGSAIIAAAEEDDARLGRSFNAPVVDLKLASGLRMGELLALRWGPGGLDLEKSIVGVRASLDRVRDENGRYPEHGPKSKAGRRDVPLPPEVVARLRRHRLATGRPADGALVFATAEGQPLSPAPAYRAFKRACWRAGVLSGRVAVDQALLEQPSWAALKRALRQAGLSDPFPCPHECRHAFGTHMLYAGLSPHADAKLLGHSDAGLVLRRYGHALPDELAGAGDKLSAWRRARGL